MITIKRAAQLTGVPTATLRAWERRYGLGAGARTESGYRLYDSQAILDIQDMQRRVAAGTPPQVAAAEVLAARVIGPTSVGQGASDPLTGQFLQAVAALDESALSRVLDAAFASGSFEHVVDTWLSPSMRRIGELWIEGQMDIAAEHFASHAVMRRLSAAFEAAGQPASGPNVLIGTPSGSTHEIGSLAFATAVRRAGLRVSYLGADIPADSWVAAVERHNADAVTISVPMPEDIPTARDCADALTSAATPVAVTVGGPCAALVAGTAMVLRGGVGDSAAMLAAALA